MKRKWMETNLTNEDHHKMDALLGNLLDWHASGEISKSSIVNLIAHIISAAAIGNPAQVYQWIQEPDVVARWKARVTKTS